MKKVLILILLGFLLPSAILTVEEAQAVCAQATIQLTQDLTLERMAFDARLAVTNNLPDKDLQGLRVDVAIRDTDGNPKNDLFLMKISSITNINAVDGSDSVKAGAKAEIHWLIIPSPGAGGQSPAGIEYFVGATLTYTVDGKQEVVPISPGRITVKPAAQLVIDYFTPYTVLGDNPYTPEVESSIPFPLAIRVLNDGYGSALDLKIDSAQPQITRNDQGLLVDFKLLDAFVNGSSVLSSLTVNLGNLESKKIATAYWDMTSTLSGTFSKFAVSFSHAAELGGELTSIIKETNAYYLIHMIKVNLPGRDDLLDFLADTDKDPDHLPDAIFESEIPTGFTTRDAARSLVTVVGPASISDRPTPQSPAVTLVLRQTTATGWIYTRLPDPSQGLLKLLDVVRADGIHLDPHNFWVDEGLDDNHQQ